MFTMRAPHLAPADARHGETWRLLAIGLAAGLALATLAADPLALLAGFAVASRIRWTTQGSRLVASAGGLIAIALLIADDLAGWAGASALGVIAGVPAGACLACSFTLLRHPKAPAAPIYVRWWLVAPAVLGLAQIGTWTLLLVAATLCSALARAASTRNPERSEGKRGGLAVGLASAGAVIAALLHGLDAAPGSLGLMVVVAIAALATVATALLISGDGARPVVLERFVGCALSAFAIAAALDRAVQAVALALLASAAAQLAAFALVAIGLERARARRSSRQAELAVLVPLVVYAVVLTFAG